MEKHGKRFLALLLTLAMALSLMGVTALAGDGTEAESGDAEIAETEAVPEENEIALLDEIEDEEWITLTNGGELSSGYYRLASDVKMTVDITIPYGAEVTIDLAGQALKGTGTASAITNYGTFTLEDSSGNDSGTLTGPTNLEYSVSGGGVYNEGTFVMNGGTICNNNVSGSGAGVYNTCTYTNISGTYSYSDGIFVMNGGSISGNNGSGVGSYSYSTFTMNGGTISDNSNYGVQVASYSTFTMNEGEISSNSSSGVYVDRSTFTMNSGEISDNTNTRGDGGGVYVDGSTFTMTGGSITGNTSGNADNGRIQQGGGVYKSANSSMYISGNAEISGNTAAKRGGLWYCDYVTDNVYLSISQDNYPTRSYIQLTGPLTEGACIGVTTSIEPTTDNSVQITSAESSTDYYASSAQYFFSDAGYTVQTNESGKYVELCYTGPTVTYSANGATGSVPTDAGGYAEGDTVTVLGADDLSRDGYHFTGWNTSANGSGTTYQAGDTFAITENVVLYAQWEAHSYIGSATFNWSNDNSCTAAAVCDVCGESVNLACNVINVATDPTCTEDGKTVYTATATDPNGVTFSDTKTVTIPATGHSVVVDVAVEPTCTEPGLSAGSHCSGCGEVFAAQAEIPALGHDWRVTFTWANDYTATYSAVCSRDSSHTDSGSAAVTHETTTAATCTAAGVETYTATVTLDGVTYSSTTTAVIAALGHDYAAVVTAPTCTTEGYTTHTCTRCGDSYVDDYTDALGHTWGDVVWGEWTESDDGSWTITAGRVCSVCDAVEDLNVDVVRSTEDATCTKAGTITYTASVKLDGEIVTCPTSKVLTNTALGHDWDLENAEWTWTESDEGYIASVTVVCNNAEHPETVIANVTAVTTESTCETAGRTVYTATAVLSDGTELTDSKTIAIPATGHDWDTVDVAWDWAEDHSTANLVLTCKNDSSHKNEIAATVTGVTTDPTCTVTGETVYTATASYEGVTYTDSKTVTLAALGHDYVGEVTLEPTCTETGEMTYTCSRCGDDYTELIAALGHDYDYANGTWSWDGCSSATLTAVCKNDSSHTDIQTATVSNAVTTAPGCETTGVRTYTATVTVGDVSYTDTKTETIPATGHTVVIDAAVEPSCTETGLTEGSHCSACGTVITAQEVIPALGHDYVAAVADPTCTEQGYTTYVCSRCGDNYVDDYTDALGHAWDNGEVTTEPTCTEDGEMTYTCTRCGATYTETIAATGHTAVTDPAVDPTCTDTGLTEGSHCSVCGTVITAQEVIPALGHDYVGTVTLAPTCTETGEMTYTCSRCGDDYTESIAALGHDYVGEVTTPATYETDGEIIYTCTRCGDSYTATIPQLTNGLDVKGSSGIEANVEIQGDPDAYYVLDIEDINDGVSETESALIEAAVEETFSDMDANYYYLDISLERYINSELAEHIEFTDWAIRITVGIPGAISGADDYVVVRIHEENGEIVVTILDTLYDAETGTVTFETDEFSTYAIVALSTVEDDTSVSEDAKTDAGLPTDGTDNAENSSSAEDASAAGSESPKTADGAPVYVVMLLMLCAVCGCAVLVVRRRA